MDVYKRPYIGEIYGTKSARVRHPYPRSLFHDYSVFPLFPLDTGAFLFCMDTFGVADGDSLLKLLQSGELFKPWIENGKFDWNLSYQDSKDSALRNLIEKQAWINRLYFLLPLAQQYFRTRDEAASEQWFRLLDKWSRAQPYREWKCKNFYKESDLVWFDMQVCWRTLVLMHSIHLLSDSVALTRSRWKRVYSILEFHVNHLLREGAKQLASGGHGNHFLQKGTALLYAGCCFPEFGNAEACLKIGRGIVEKMNREEIHADGGSAESSPSYCLFISRLFLDAFVVMQKNAQPEIKGLRESLQRQYTWISHMASPKRETLLFNDSATMNADTDLKVVSSIFPLRIPKAKESFVFPVSQMGRIANRNFQVYFDATPMCDRWHDHHGKLTLIVYWRGEPLIVDSGCSNYDHFLREQYLTRSQAHNVVHVHEKPELNWGEEMEQALPVITIKKFSSTEVRFLHVLKWKARNLDYHWSRTVKLSGETLQILDEVESKNAITATQLFHFAPLNLTLTPDQTAATVRGAGHDFQLKKLKNARLEYKAAVGLDNRLTYAPCILQTGHGRRLSFDFHITS